MRGNVAVLARACAVGLVALTAQAAPASAQDASSIEVASPILTIDQERLYQESDWGVRVEVDIDAASARLAAENRRIEARLSQEELDLTESRAGMTPAAFRAAADAFDARVVEIRRAQDAKARDLTQIRETERQRFFESAFPLLGATLRSRGAVAILDNRAIFLAADAIDVTDEVLERVNAELGTGAEGAAPVGQFDDAEDETPDSPGTEGVGTRETGQP